MITSDTAPDSTPARSSADRMAMVPSSAADRGLIAPLKLPTGVRAALAMTTWLMVGPQFERRI